MKKLESLWEEPTKEEYDVIYKVERTKKYFGGKMNFIVKNNINPKDFINIRNNLNWNNLPYDLVKRAIDGSMVNVSVFEQEKCIGVGRIVGDKVLKGMLTDIMVIKEYQNKGVGKLIVTSLISELEKRTNRKIWIIS